MEYYKHYIALKETLKLYLEHKEYRLSNVEPNSQNNEEDFHIENKFAKEIKDSFINEYHKYFDTDYFFGCSYKIYQETYKKRLEDYKATFFDVDEMEFIKSEVDEGVFNHKFKRYKSDYLEDSEMQIDEGLEKQIYYSLKKRFEYLQQRAKENGFNLIYNELESSESYFLDPLKQPLELKNNKTRNSKPKWFPIGLGFANGKIQRKIKTDLSARKIAKEYKLDSFHNYISLTISDTLNDPKNIYSDSNKLKLIYDHCIENNITICDHFMVAYNKKYN